MPEQQTGPTGGDSPLTSYESTIEAAREAVDRGMSAAAAQQAAAGSWMDSGVPERDQIVDPERFKS
jgi:hypothetical protein